MSELDKQYKPDNSDITSMAFDSFNSKIKADIIKAKNKPRKVHGKLKAEVKAARDNIEFHLELKSINDMYCYD